MYLGVCVCVCRCLPHSKCMAVSNFCSYHQGDAIVSVLLPQESTVSQRTLCYLVSTVRGTQSPCYACYNPPTCSVISNVWCGAGRQEGHPHPRLPGRRRGCDSSGHQRTHSSHYGHLLSRDISQHEQALHSASACAVLL